MITLPRVVCAVASLLACLSALHAVAEHPDLDARERVIIAGSVTPGDAPTRLADQLGLFANAGAEVEVTSHSSGAAALNELLQRRADFALTAVSPFAVALLNQNETEVLDGEELVVLASIGRSNNTHHVVVATEDRDFRPQQLIGRRIGVMPGTTSEYFWSGFAPLHGIAADVVELSLLDVEAMIPALQAREIDAAVVWDPWPLRMEEALGGDVTELSDQRIDSMSWLLVTRRVVAERHPRLCEQLLQAYLRAESIIHEDSARAQALEAEASGIPLQHVQRLSRSIIYSLGLDWSLLSEINHQVAWRLAQTGRDSNIVFPPERYLAPEPLAGVAPARLLLPRYWESEERP